LIASVTLALNVTSAHSFEDRGNIVFNQMLKCLKLPADAPSAYNFMVVAVIKDGADVFSHSDGGARKLMDKKSADPSL
ncbi:hypothetical protein ACC676_39620, partial [Rhizobium ruizarguesonis]